MLLNVLGIAVIGYVLFAALLYFTQARLLYLPNIPGRDLMVTPDAYGLVYENVEFETADGETLHGWFLPAGDAQGTVLILHGNAGNISHRLDTLRIWHGLGFNAFIFDYRGYGQSTGRPSEPGTYRDARAAWRYLTETRGLRADRIVLFGRSLGGAVAAYLAVQVRPAGLIVESTFTSVPDIAADVYPWLPGRWLSRFQYPARELITQVRRPVLVVHSPDDEIIPFRHGQALYAAANEPKTLLELRGGHNEGFLLHERNYVRGLREFLRQHGLIPD